MQLHYCTSIGEWALEAPHHNGALEGETGLVMKVSHMTFMYISHNLNSHRKLIDYMPFQQTWTDLMFLMKAKNSL